MAKRTLPNIVILTGAGISAESGIRTFRAADGLWENHRIEDVATPEGFRRNPELVRQFYNQRRRQLQQAEIQPNAAHYALAELERFFGENVLLVTQNVDNLHERAGSKNLIHLHGELLKVRCVHCGSVVRWHSDITANDYCKTCGGGLRPHIVWFGEMPFETERIYTALQQCDYFLSIGTSGNVYPAAGFVEEANFADAVTVELNLEPSKSGTAFKETDYGPASQVVPAYCRKLIGLVSA
ncbi:NAD-dependent deacetylase [Chelonobacter oris]|uniref:NAD-dependent protein deacylase n=1 Tax=Chelonobacter oris TaxID=505317 RepID=A0A0A3AN06_9PAST|nr:Sir2 family NAD+-dependent deacetylase [Chelonobacter oris]KGQ70676.1 NAD-dependent deacetylase [Chelonobacter oris]